MPEVRVQPRSVYEHHIIISKANTSLSWTFSTKKKSICFGLYYRPQQGNRSTRVSFDRKRNLSLSQNSKAKLTADEILHHYYSDTEDGDTTTPPNDIKKRHSIVPSIKDASVSIHSRNNNRRKSTSAVSVVNLLENDFIELIPIDQVNSSKETIVGSYLAEEVGNYVLIFDNMFSRNTSKLLTFTVTSDEPMDEGLDEYDMSGWLLKKRRKRMQGWAKRWFELSSTGVLSYSVRKGDIKRGSLQIVLATIALSPEQQTIHLDSGTTLFHLKALSPSSFDAWLKCIRAKRIENTGVMWDHDVTGGIQSAISIIPDSNEIYHQDMAKGLQSMETELKSLKLLVSKDLTTLLNSASYSPTHDASSLSTTAQVSGLKIRFPFKRGNSTNSEEIQSKAAPVHTMTMIEQLSRSIQVLTDYRNQVSDAYFKNYDSVLARGHPLDVPSRTGTGFLSHRSASFYSYSAHSDQFYDAEDVFLNEDNESTFGSIVIDSEDEEKNSSLSIASKLNKSIDTVIRRKKLPHPVAVKTISFLGILRKNIGKDLSTISLPISLNEPINLMQRLCEELEYSELLDKAASHTSSMDRLMYVTVFAISGYASGQYRIGRKPFNPLMCETYECIRPDKGFKFISEKVIHHPNVIACHAESDNFEYSQTYFGKTKFWGKSLELITEGQVNISLTGHDDHYTFSKPSSWLRNLVTGVKYLEHIGEMRVSNHATGEYAMVTFKEAASTSFFSGDTAALRNHVVCKLYNTQGACVKEVMGKWSESLSEVIGPDQYAVLWRSKPPSIPDYKDYYGLTQFSMEINEITSLEKGQLPITDTRYRPDQTLFEHGEVEKAEEEKVRIEQFQRDRRKQYQQINKSWDPLWFELRPDKYSPTGDSWKYKGGYWEARNTGQWPKEILQLW